MPYCVSLSNAEPSGIRPALYWKHYQMRACSESLACISIGRVMVTVVLLSMGESLEAQGTTCQELFSKRLKALEKGSRWSFSSPPIAWQSAL